MSSPVRSRLPRLLAALLLGAFVATSSGVSLLELAWHVRYADDTHPRAPHFEVAGGSAHADHCQLGLVHACGRLLEGEPSRLGPAPLVRLGSRAGDAPPVWRVASALSLPRAPPSPIG